MAIAQSLWASEQDESAGGEKWSARRAAHHQEAHVSNVDQPELAQAQLRRAALWEGGAKSVAALMGSKQEANCSGPGRRARAQEREGGRRGW